MILSCIFFHFLDSDPDSLKMQDPDPDSMNKDPQHCFCGVGFGTREQRITKIRIKIKEYNHVPTALKVIPGRFFFNFLRGC
jgi:hypothetical protein